MPVEDAARGELVLPAVGVLAVGHTRRATEHSRIRLVDEAIELSGPALHDIAVNGAGKLVLDNLQQDALTVAIHGSGSVRANGSTDRLNVQIIGSGDANLAQLAVQSSKIFIAGSGAADVAPSDDADVFIAGSGHVRLHTHPRHLSSKVAGSGQIIEVLDGQKI